MHLKCKKNVYSLRILNGSSKGWWGGDWQAEESCALEGHGCLLLRHCVPSAFIALLFMPFPCFGKSSDPNDIKM